MPIPNIPAAWKSLVQLIQNGTPVDAATTNAPLNDLIQRDQHLKDLLEMLSASEALYFREAPVAPEVNPGNPVYFNKTTNRFEQGLAAIDYDPAGVWGTVAESAFVWGIVTRKETATVGDIITFGVGRDIDMSQAIDDITISGPRYLSHTIPGKLVRDKPPISCYVGYWNAASNIMLVAPTPKNLLEEHIHYRYQLYARPAGQPNNPAYGEQHEVLVPDTNLPGWLPADHPSFGGMAPPGAKFGYNMAQHPELGGTFPPMPIDSYYMEVYGKGWGTGRETGEAVRVDNNGIWWMKNDWGWAPWSIDWWEMIDPSSSMSSVDGGPPGLLPPPVDLLQGHGYPDPANLYTLSVYLWFTRMTLKTSDAMVASLEVCEGTPIEILDCNCDKPAKTGNLRLRLDMAFQKDPLFIDGALVLKDVSGITFKQGYIVEKIKSLSPNIIVTGTAEVTDPLSGYVQRTITLDFLNPIANDRELEVSLVGLDNAREESISNVLFLGFTASVDASIRGKIDVPSVAMSAVSNMKLRLRILGTAAGTMPKLSLSYRRIPIGSTIPYTLPSADTALADIDLSLVNGGAPIGANAVVEVESAAFPVAIGDTVFFTIRRNGVAVTDTYGGTVGLIRQKGIVAT